MSHLANLCYENQYLMTVDEMGLTPQVFERMTFYVGAMLTGDRVEIGDVEYGFMDVNDKILAFRTKPGNKGIVNRITEQEMITEWAYCWYDAASPTLKILKD